jgi:hypothetical protein
MPTLFLVIRDEKVSEILTHRPGSEWERSGHEKVCLIDSTDPQFNAIKVGSDWPNRENRYFIERMKATGDEVARLALVAKHTERFGETVVAKCRTILDKELASREQ